MAEMIKLNDLLSDNVLTVEDSLYEKRVEYYKKCKMRNEVLTIKFSGIQNGSMFIEDNGLRVVLPKEDLANIHTNFKPSLRIAFSVVVQDVDEETGIVTVSAANLKKDAKEKYIQTIDNHLANHTTVTVRAKVVYIDESRHRVIIDIAGAGVKGFIPVEEWRDAYTYRLMSVAKIGAIINVVILGKGKNKDLGYRCSRKQALGKSSWEGIEQRFPLKTVVKIKCAYVSKNEWFGHIEGLDEIEAYCPFPDDRAATPIIVGQEYLCYVYMVSEKDKQLRCRVVKTIE